MTSQPPHDRPRPSSVGGLTSLDASRREALETSLQSLPTTFPRRHRSYADWIHSSHATERWRIIDVLTKAQAEDAAVAYASLRSPSTMVDLNQPCKWGKVLASLIGCCVTPSVHFEPATGRMAMHEHRCKHRLCPRCASIRARTLSSRTLDILSRMDSPRMITLTQRSTDEPLGVQLRSLTAAFARLRRGNTWRSRVTGGVYLIEVTYNYATDQWHPHLHVLCDGQYFPQRDLSDAWARVTGDSSIVDIRKVHSHRAAASYVTKYVNKTTSIRDLPDDRICEWADQVRSIRLLQTFGNIHAASISEDEPDSRPERVHVIGLNQLTYHANRGDAEAARLIPALISATHDRVSDGDETAARDLEARNRELVERVRRWEQSERANRDHSPTRRTGHRRPVDPDAVRSLWNWQVPNANPPA